MIIYEVNLEIQSDIVNAYMQWLHEHITVMLTYPGFTKVTLLEQEVETSSLCDYKKITVQYWINRREDLQYYFENHATAMRNDGILKFGEKFRAKRRIFKIIQ